MQPSEVTRKSKNLGKLLEPKRVNVVKNMNFELRDQQNPVGILGETNKDHKVQASIGSSIQPFGSIHTETAPVKQTEKTNSLFRKRSPILKNGRSPVKPKETAILKN